MGASYNPRGVYRTRERYTTHNGRRYRNDSDKPRLCLVTGKPGELQTWYFPKVTLLTRRGPRTVDALVKVQRNDRVVWLIAEIDEEAPTAESLEREQAVAMPTLRISGERILSEDFMPWLLSQLEAFLERYGEIERAA